MTPRVFFLLVATAFAGTTVHADTLTMDLTTTFPGYPSPSTTPNLSAVFQDVPGGVDLTLSASGLPAGYTIENWWVNLNPLVNPGIWGPTAFTSETHSAGMTPALAVSSPGFDFSQAGPPSGQYFGVFFNGFSGFANGNSITYFITSTFPYFNVTSFDLTDSDIGPLEPGSGPYFAAAEVIDSSANPPDYLFGAESAVISSVPERASTLLSLCFAVGGLMAVFSPRRMGLHCNKRSSTLVGKCVEVILR